MIVLITGGANHTFRQLQNCAQTALKDYVRRVTNWPDVVVDEPIGDGQTAPKPIGPPTTNLNFLSKNGRLMRPDCVPLELRNVSDPNIPFNDLGPGDWICQGEDPGDILPPNVIGMATTVRVDILALVAMALVSMWHTRWR